MSEKMEYTLVKHLGKVSEHNGMNLEINIVSWNHRPPKFDIRKWNADRTEISSGQTFTREEAEKVLEILQKYLDETK